MRYPCIINLIHCAHASSLLISSPLACNGTIVNDTEMGEVIQLQGDQRKDVQEFLVDKRDGLQLDAKTIKVLNSSPLSPARLSWMKLKSAKVHGF